MTNENKNNEFVSNFVFYSKAKRKHMRVRKWVQFCQKLTRPKVGTNQP